MKVVISGVNLTEGGILSVLEDCTKAASNLLKILDIEFILLIHKKELLLNLNDKIIIKEFPKIKHSWVKRLHFEYIYCKSLSRKIKPDLWISLHDMTPNVIAPIQVVYCHNPSLFFKSKLKDFFVDYKLFLFSFFYKYLYKTNIKKNKYVIVQQSWIRDKFEKLFDINTIVAYPSIDIKNFHIKNTSTEDLKFNKYAFFYPSFPRIFKNFEVLFDAVTALSVDRTDFCLIVTFDQKQNKLADQLYKKYSSCKNIKFIGKQSRDTVYKIFNSIDCLIFPSKLETWGLPLTEAKSFNKPILVADLEYAHENIGDYKRVKFFDADDSRSLANYMSEMIDGRLVFDHNKPIIPEQPFFTNWDDLLQFLIKISNNNSPNIL